MIIIMNALNGVWSETYTLQTIIKEELEKLAKILQKILILKIKFPVKIRGIYNIEKKEEKNVVIVCRFLLQKK